MRLQLLLLTIYSPLLLFPQTQTEWSDHPPWSGVWKRDSSLTRMLGFDSKVEQSNAYGKLEIEFLASREAAIAVIGEEKVRTFQEHIRKWTSSGNHTVVAAGHLMIEGPKKDKKVCFVTRANRETFLWIGDQTDATTAAKVSHVRGARPNHDKLFLDFGGLIKGQFKYASRAGTPLFPVIGYHQAEED